MANTFYWLPHYWGSFSFCSQVVIQARELFQRKALTVHPLINSHNIITISVFIASFFSHVLAQSVLSRLQFLVCVCPCHCSRAYSCIQPYKTNVSKGQQNRKSRFFKVLQPYSKVRLFLYSTIFHYIFVKLMHSPNYSSCWVLLGFHRISQPYSKSTLATTFYYIIRL